MNKFDVAVLGIGQTGVTHVGAAKTSSYVRNIYGYEPVPARAELRGCELGITGVSDLDLILNNPAIKFVSIASPNSTHSVLAEKALKAGKAVMFANPLIWLMPSKLDTEVMSSLHKLIILHLKYRDRIFAGEIYSIGNEPDGASICGFQSHDAGSNHGFFVFYREHNAIEEAKIHAGMTFPGNAVLTRIAGNADSSVESISTNELSVKMSKNCSFAFYSY